MLLLLCSEYSSHYMSFIRKYRVGGKIYLAEVESRRVKGKVVQRFIRYVGKQADGKTILSTSISDVSVSEVRLYGPLLVLHHLAQEIGLPEHLGPYANEILSMVYAHCLDYRSLNHMRRCSLAPTSIGCCNWNNSPKSDCCGPWTSSSKPMGRSCNAPSLTRSSSAIT